MQQENLKKILQTGYKLIALETNNPEQTINDFRPLVREGKAIYIWEKGIGLYRMEASHIKRPNTTTPEMVINHIRQSKLFGIYLLVGFSTELKDRNLIPFLDQIIQQKKGDKTIILVDHYFEYPHKIMGNLLITHEPDVKAEHELNQIA